MPGGSDGKEFACNVGDPGSIPGSGGSLEKGMATDSSILAWRIPRREGPGGLQSMEFRRNFLNCCYSEKSSTVNSLSNNEREKQTDPQFDLLPDKNNYSSIIDIVDTFK